MVDTYTSYDKLRHRLLINQIALFYPLNMFHLPHLKSEMLFSKVNLIVRYICEAKSLTFDFLVTQNVTHVF